jgi:two pore calcium channel protein 3
MMPMYDESRLWALLFVVYITVGVFLLMNLVLAVVYNNYRRHFKTGATVCCC